MLVFDDESDGIGMCLRNTFIFSNSVSSPIDVKEKKSKADGILIGDLVVPRLVFLRPGDVAVVNELRLIALLELAFKDLLFGLQREVLVVSTPVVQVVIAEADSS